MGRQEITVLRLHDVSGVSVFWLWGQKAISNDLITWFLAVPQAFQRRQLKDDSRPITRNFPSQRKHEKLTNKFYWTITVSFHSLVFLQEIVSWSDKSLRQTQAKKLLQSFIKTWVTERKQTKAPRPMRSSTERGWQTKRVIFVYFYRLADASIFILFSLNTFNLFSDILLKPSSLSSSPSLCFPKFVLLNSYHLHTRYIFLDSLSRFFTFSIISFLITELAKRSCDLCT